jgi:N-acetylglutamate synthase-like GNAT family acetyltransferase
VEKYPDEGELKTCGQEDFNTIYEIINEAAIAYHGVIPDDMWHEPYMTTEQLRAQINDGVQFWKYSEQNQILGVMGIQFKGEVTLIRHAYVRTAKRNKGIGGRLLQNLHAQTGTPVLIGTWAAAAWAITFYQRHGFRLLSDAAKDRVLRKYWTIPERQIATSVVLASADWIEK